MASSVMIEISEDNSDSLRLDQSSRRLLLDLRRLGLAASLPSAQTPPGAKAAGAITLATLVVGLSGPAAARALVTGLFAWLGPRKGSVKISSGDTSIELSAATRAERERLVEWLTTRGE